MGENESDDCRQEVSTHKQELKIPMACYGNTTRYSDDLYSPKQKLLTALGVEGADLDAIALSSGNTRSLCEAALKYLLERTEVCRATYSLEVKGVLAAKLNSEFMTIKSMLNKEYRKQ